ncbi:hypothetical protein CTAYLR_009300 [Chrysophaeum taylorii]|uniref:Major facilitator superfamily (MFS) profile domain-containing protein n=1 Tax=Chrysophaeum taylorii TaxID=2483200 RepID=A0AAD7UL93_9STRA|nr:hypothetical protein CTAYLR_009300 [Chrysophaeum taylorii]
MCRGEQAPLLGGASIEAVIEGIGYGPYQRRMTFLTALLWCGDSMEVSLLAFLYSCVGGSFDLDSFQAASLVSIVFAGEVVGAAIAGPLADRFGRRPLSLSSACLVGFGGLLTAGAQNFAQFAVFRFLVGVGVGAFGVPFDLIAEFLPKDARGRNLASLEFSWAIGAAYVAGVSWIVRRSWRFLVLACALPFVFVFVAMALLLDESPRWLVVEGDRAAAGRVLDRVAEANGAAPPPPVGGAPQALHKQDFGEVLRRPHTWRVLLIWGTSGLGFYATSLLVTRIFGSSGGRCRFNYPFILAISSSEFVGIAVLVRFIDSGRVPCQTAGYIGSGAALSLLALGTGTYANLALLYLGLGAMMLATSASWVQIAELYETEERGTAHGLAITVTRVAAFGAPYLVDSSLPLPLVALVVATIGAIMPGLLVAGLPETAGRPLDSTTATDN